MDSEIKGWMIFSWIALPTVMYGGYALLYLVVGNKDTEFRRTWFRAGHAHAGVLLLLSLLYYDYMGRTELPGLWKHVGCGLLTAGVLAQSGGFFIHMLKGEPGKASTGTTVTTAGAIGLTAAIVVLVYGLVTG